MEFWTDPLKDDDKEIEVYDLASANHAAKIANDLHFSIFYMGQNMLKELGRMGKENFDRQVALLEPYLTSSDSSTTESTQRITSIPNPLPSNVPQSVKNAINWLNEQFAVEESRMQAELAADTKQLREQVWLAHKHAVILSGTLMEYAEGEVEFSFYELEFD